MARNLLLGTALQTGLTFTAVMAALPAAAQPAPNARPTGGSVVAGAAAISQTGSNTRIDQSSQRAAINWQSFNVGSQQSVTFSQPSASAVALNRVTGPDPSQIAGRIDANGQIILVNQSGVNFYKGAQVNAAGVMVSAAGITNQNFMAGVMKFDQPGKSERARSSNQGTHHREAGGPRGAGGAAGGELRRHHRAAWAMWCWPVRRPRRSICMATGCCRSM